ncbi:PAS domain-containing sensor histidine kinase [Alkalihalobacillus deserti]|uniref:PAS domain-containing sensor histidine kinase n=1 Tax=Alkalihalobacillus deserti TaxID=2879466 RepID=UPI001D15AD20|nr:PAS domain-containing sensor histidine kinase [Alkalihalobacillus deserti]
MSKISVIIIYLSSSFIWFNVSEYTFVHLLNLNPNSNVREFIFVICTAIFIYYLLIKKEKLVTAKKEEHKISSLMNAMVDFVNFKDGEGRWLTCNTFGLELFQLGNVDYKGKKDSELAQYTDFYGDALRYCEISDEETWREGTINRCEETILLPNGKTKTFDTIKVPLFDEKGDREALVVMGRDITERKEAEEQLLVSQMKYKSLFEHSPDLIYMTDLNGVVTNSNAQITAISGYSIDELIGQPILKFIADQDKDRADYAFQMVLQTKKACSKSHVHVKHKNGKMLSLDCTYVPIIVNNEVIGVTGFSRDVTQLIETENRLRKAEKLSVVGELAASVAHEIRNPLTALKGFVQLFKMEDNGPDRFYNIMLQELDRINQIVGELLVLSKPQETKFTICNIEEIMEDVIGLLQSQTNLYGSELKLEFENSLPMLDCEANLLKQLFINIIKNATEASAKSITIQIKKDRDEHLSITIIDDGCGIAEDRINKLGEPFYSSKEKGTGLGLTVSFKIVEEHQGTIQYESEIGKGTTVKVRLPLSKSEDKLVNKHT